jgi:ribose transport system ATP-binding protein
MSVLELREIRKSFGPTIALYGVSLVLRKGEVHALIGENGAGKSTLMNVLSGAMRQDSGSMSLNGEDYAPTSALDARRNGITLIHQELMLAPHLTVAENVLMGLEKARFSWLDQKRLNKRALAVLENFDHPEITPDVAVGKLSVAAQQVVEICRAIAVESTIILMDEPTSSLPRHDVQRLFEQIRKLKSAGISIIYISHFLEEIREIADSFTVLRNGKSVAAGKIADVTDEFLISKMVGRAVDDLFPQREVTSNADAVLRVENLSAPPLLQNASFELRRGEVFGIAGLMGSGRSDLLRAIFGLQTYASGTVAVEGRPSASTVSPGVSISRGLGYLSEDRKVEGLGQSLSIADNITVTRYSTCSKKGWLNLDLQKKQAEKLIGDVGIKTTNAFQVVKELSGGNQQKVAIARLVHQDADILLLDEPTRGIDIGSKAQIYQTIAEMAGRGKAVVMVSSYLPELFGMCDRLAVMSRGRLSAAKPIDEWTPESVMLAAISSGTNRNGP